MLRIKRNSKIKTVRHIIPSELIKKGDFDPGFDEIKEKIERCRSSQRLSAYPKIKGDIDACDSIVEKIEKKEATKDDYDYLLVKVNNMAIPLLRE